MMVVDLKGEKNIDFLRKLFTTIDTSPLQPTMIWVKSGHQGNPHWFTNYSVLNCAERSDAFARNVDAVTLIPRTGMWYCVPWSHWVKLCIILGIDAYNSNTILLFSYFWFMCCLQRVWSKLREKNFQSSEFPITYTICLHQFENIGNI